MWITTFSCAKANRFERVGAATTADLSAALRDEKKSLTPAKKLWHQYFILPGMPIKSPAAEFDPKFAPVFAALKQAFSGCVAGLQVTGDSPVEYTLMTQGPSPFPQHKGQPMYFGQVRVGKAYVAFHLMPLYMNAKLTATISPALKKRMQGKTCFNFKAMPEAELLAELKSLAEAGAECFRAKKWA
jgi:hypothetical protein